MEQGTRREGTSHLGKGRKKGKQSEMGRWGSLTVLMGA